MELNRRKYYKGFIKRVCEKNDNINELSVTVLGSSSYHNRNKDLSVFDPNVDKDHEKTEKENNNNNSQESVENCRNPPYEEVEMQEVIHDDQAIIAGIALGLENSTDIIQQSLDDADVSELAEIISPEENNVRDIEIPDMTKERKCKRSVALLDFMSDDEEYNWDSTSWKETDESSSDEDLSNKKKKKKIVCMDGKVGQAGLKKKRGNKKNICKDARSKGKCYIKKDGFVVQTKELQPNPCIGKKCPWKCENIDGEKRQRIFHYFYELSNQRKKDWLVAMSSKVEIKRKRSKNSNYRTNTFNYFINDGEGRRQVCLKFLIATLDVTQRYIYYTISNAHEGISKSDGRGKCIPANKTPSEAKETAKNFIMSLPALPSHYSRKDSTRLSHCNNKYY